jgi:hypothetical protein
MSARTGPWRQTAMAGERRPHQRPRQGGGLGNYRRDLGLTPRHYGRNGYLFCHGQVKWLKTCRRATDTYAYLVRGMWAPQGDD